MSKISTVLWNYYYFDLSLFPQNLLYHLSGWIFSTLKRLLSLSGRVLPCLPLCLHPGISWIPGSDVEISSLPPSSWLSGVADCWFMCWTYIYIYKSTGLFPAPFRIQDIVLAGSECRSPSPAAHQSRTLSIVWCRRWLWSCRSPLPCGRVSAGAGHGLFGTALAKEITRSPQKGAHAGNWKQDCVFKVLSPVLLWFPCKAFSCLRVAVSLTLVMSKIFKQPCPIFKY